MIAGLAYLKKITAIKQMIAAAIRKYMLIWHTFTIATMMRTGPSSASIMPKKSTLSIIPISFENLLTRVPEGVVSKNLPGQRTIDWIIFKWFASLALRRVTAKQ